MSLEFLKNISLAQNAVVKSAVAKTRTAASRNPEKADLRVYKDGSMYPSVALVANDNLQFTDKEAADKGNGYDVFRSDQWPNTQHLPKDQRVIFIALVPKDSPKVDLFGATKYDDEGKPKADVLTQGSKTVGEDLLVWLSEIYGVTPGEKGYIDLTFVRDAPFTLEDRIYFLPKPIRKGDKKGEIQLIRRENLTLFPLVPTALVEEDQGEPVGDAEIEDPSAYASSRPEELPEEDIPQASDPLAEADSGTALSDIEPEEGIEEDQGSIEEDPEDQGMSDDDLLSDDLDLDDSSWLNDEDEDNK